MTSRLRRDEGYVLVTAIILMTIMLAIGLAAFTSAGTEQKMSAQQRERESRLNLAEGVLSSEAYILSRNWPDTAAKAFDPTAPCTETSTTNPKCPSTTAVQSNFTALDFKLGMHWNIQIRDNGNGASDFYSDSATATQPGWDKSGPAGVPDGRLWIRAQGRIGTKTRTIVALVKAETRTVTFPNAAFVSGSVATGNAGNKVIVATGGSTAQVRCNDGGATPARDTNSCRSYDYDKGQIDGPVQSNAPIPANVLTSDQVQVLRQLAITANTYYTGCPPTDAAYSGAVVFVESGTCKLTSNTVVNSPTSPGYFIIANGTLQVLGNVSWYGAIYALNGQGAGSSTPVVDLSGNVDFHGGVFVDGSGQLLLGQSKFNLNYDPNGFPPIQSFGTVGIVQNTWRELTGS